jgi:hypothetical protein
MVERLVLSVLVGVGAFLASMPSSSHFTINNYGFGSGGIGNSASASYSLNGISGEQANQPAASASHSLNPGNNSTQQAQEPLAPTFDNPANYYDKLHLAINSSSNPSDATFAIAVSSDGFATTQYIKSDGTVGTSLSITDYQTYSAWGGASGSLVTGLHDSTTYCIKVKAMQGKFTETGYGPQSCATTAPPSLDFDIDVSASNSETSPPYQVDFGNLLAGSVSDSPTKIWFDLDTNAVNGAKIYISDQYGGLHSIGAVHTISSASVDLSGQSEGYGAQSQSVSQSSGGPISAISPYNASSQNVGILSSTIRPIYSSSAPISAARTSLLLKAIDSTTTPSGTDYTDVITAIASGSF